MNVINCFSTLFSFRDQASWLSYLAGLVAMIVIAPPAAAQGRIEVGHGVCGTSHCAEANSVLPTGVYASFNGGDLIAGAEANANFVKAYLNNGLGGNSTILSGHVDEFMLFGPGTSDITITATLHVTGSRTPDNTVIGAGFMSPGLGSHLAPPGSVIAFYSDTLSGVDAQVTQSFTLAPGDSFNLAMGISASALLNGLVDFSSTLVLGFHDLPDGYYVTSREGFSGVGSLVPEPQTAFSMLTGLFMLGWLPRRR